jgi:ElaA protein
MIVAKKFDELDTRELYDILALREDIFIVEQNCPYHDLDYKDQNSIHLYKKIEDEIVSYVRILPKGISYEKSPSIGRVITKREHRKKGYSKEILTKAIDYILTEFRESTIEISAQEYLVKFYGEFGFETRGDIYLEDNLPHIHMVFNKKS